MNTTFKNLLIVMLTVLLTAASGVAQDLSSYLETAAENNPGLKASYLEY